MSQRLHLNVSVTSKEAAVEQRVGSAFCVSCLSAVTAVGNCVDNHVLSFGGPSVQKQSIPALLEGRDALVRSQTGSGQRHFISALPPSMPSLSRPRLDGEASARGGGRFVLFGEGEAMLLIRALD